VPQWVQDGPFAFLYFFLLVVVFLRAQGTYWLGRAVAAGMLRTRWSRHFTGPRVTKAIGSIERWGWPIIPLSFLTIGFQSAVNAGAGVIRMRWIRYTLAMIPGCLVWALVYSLGGLAAFQAAVALAARSPWVLVTVIVLLGIVVTGVVLRVRRRRAERESIETLAAQADHAEN
jgi:membrane protein DedA with SNARE-associated domain